jgi:hypothetical protein
MLRVHIPAYTTQSNRLPVVRASPHAIMRVFFKRITACLSDSSEKSGLNL